MENKRIYYRIIAASTFGLSLGFAPIFVYTLPVLMKRIAEEFQWSRSEVSAGISIAMLAMAIVTPMAGYILDKLKVKWVLSISSILLSIGFLLLSWMPNSLTYFYAVCAFIGVVALGATPLSYTVLLAKWFNERLGTAIGISMLGMGVGYTITPFITAKLLETMAWRDVYLVIFAMSLLPVVNALWAIKEPNSAQDMSKKQAATIGLDFKEALRTKVFWIFTLAAFLIAVAVNGTSVHLMPLISDNGFDLGQAAKVGLVFGVAVTLARFCTGLLLDKFSLSPVAFGSFALAALGMFLLSVPNNLMTLYFGAVFLGVASGAEIDILAFGIRRYFGQKVYGTISGVIISLFTLGSVFGPMFHAMSFDKVGNYEMSMYLCAAFALVSAVVMLAVGKPRFAPPKAPAKSPAAVAPAANVSAS